MQQHVYAISAVCAAMGIRHAIICPGSRSAPLVSAFIAQPEITCYSIVDERSAAFVALGMARQSRTPVVLICTSGTAALNFYPAIAEAYYQRIPLLILTADRPPELLNQQDGQMIMQKGVYGKHVINSHELPCFENDKQAELLTETLVIKAINECHYSGNIGPVHINVPLREPLYDTNEATKYTLFSKQLFENIDDNINNITAGIYEVLTAFKNSSKKVIIIGNNWVNKSIENSINLITSTDKNVVVLADVSSNQLHQHNINNFDAVLQFASPEILDELKPEFILSFGGPLISKSLKLWLKSFKPTYHYRIQNKPYTINTYNNLTKFFMADVDTFLHRFIEGIRLNTNNNYFLTWQQYAKQANLVQTAFLKNSPWFEINATQEILNLLEPNFVLHLGNSSVIRYVSWLGIPLNNLEAYGNRGTSGIDGLLSSAIGSAIINPEKTHLLLIGDLSFWYDQNAFWQNQALPNNLIVFVFNNGGGGIFNWIDGPSSKPENLHYYTTPQNIQIKPVVLNHGINYAYANNFNSLTTEFKAAVSKKQLTVIELDFKNTENFNLIKTFKNLSLTP